MENNNQDSGKSSRQRYEHNDPMSATPAPMRLWFGIFMVIFYIGIGLLLIIANKTFAIFSPVISIVIGAILCLYGIFRGYRLWKG